MVLTFMFQAFILTKIILSETVWIKRGYEYVGVLCGDLKAGTHITINYQLPDGIRHFQRHVCIESEKYSRTRRAIGD